MKKILCLILAICTLLLLCGCTSKDEPMLEPANFYYRNSQISYETSSGLISPQVTEIAHHNGNLINILDAYLKGPTNSEHYHTFPSGTQLVSLDIKDSNAKIQLSNDFARLSGIHLSISCACLSMTVMELTGATSVTISTVSTTLDGNQSITMDMQSILLFDSSYTNE